MDEKATISGLSDGSNGLNQLNLPWLTVLDTQTLTESLSKLKSYGGGVLVLSKGSYAISQDMTVDAGIMLHFLPGAELNISKGKTVTINGKISAGRSRIFAGQGMVRGQPQVDAIAPQWFGASANGTANDAAAIQSSIDLAAASGADVMLEPGVYSVDQIIMKNNVKLIGKTGAVLQSPDPKVSDVIIRATGVHSFEVAGLEGKIDFFVADSSDFVIRDMKVEGNSNGWYFYRSSGGYIAGNQLLNLNNKTERIIYVNDCEYMTIENNRIKNAVLFNGVGPNLNTGINVSSSIHCKVLFNHVENCGGQGILFDTNIGITDPKERLCYSNMAMGNTLIGNGQEGITAFSSQQYETYDIVITNNIAINNRYNGIELWGVRQIVVESNSISAPDMKQFSFGAINIFASKDVIVNGNSIDTVPTSGIATAHGSQYPEPNCSNIIITNNRIQTWNNLDLSPVTSHDQNCGINLFDAEFSVVQGNILVDTKKMRKNTVKAISVVSGHNLIRGNVNPGNLLIDDHTEADQVWVGAQLAERNPLLRMSLLPGDLNNGNMAAIDAGSIWYNHDKLALFYKGYLKTMVAPIYINENATAGYPGEDFTPGYFNYQSRTGKLYYRGKPDNSNGKYSEIVMRDKFINLRRSTEVTKTPIAGDTYYDTNLKKPVYFDGTNWRDYSGNIVRVTP
ncbi:hypothetical protein JCM10914A_09820 [Paenibacillus sp. JCM 10914]